MIVIFQLYHWCTPVQLDKVHGNTLGVLLDHRSSIKPDHKLYSDAEFFSNLFVEGFRQQGVVGDLE